MCECWKHRYHVVHCIRGKSEVWDHSQGTWDTVLRFVYPENIENYPSEWYVHGMSADDLRARAEGRP